MKCLSNKPDQRFDQSLLPGPALAPLSALSPTLVLRAIRNTYVEPPGFDPHDDSDYLTSEHWYSVFVCLLVGLGHAGLLRSGFGAFVRALRPIQRASVCACGREQSVQDILPGEPSASPAAFEVVRLPDRAASTPCPLPLVLRVALLTTNPRHPCHRSR